MKIKAIRLVAYGPFTDVRIDLPDTLSDFHLLFGPNEAGKSSTLRALRHMFFGIPARTADNFLHGYAHLRIGATLYHSSGETISFLRRKGKAKTLRGPDDETVLGDDALAAFLGGVGLEIFEQMFAIGHEELIRGGEEIVSGKGHVGQALFSAGAGLFRLQSIQKKLELDCGTLFKPGGSTPSINQAIKALRTLRKNQKDALLLPKTWQTQDRELREANIQLESVKHRLKEIQQREAKLKRIGKALPLIARKMELEDELAAVADVPDLPDDFGDKRRDAEKELKVATRDLHRHEKTMKDLQKRLTSLELPAPLLENASSIEMLQHALGSHRKALKDRPGLEGRMRMLEQQANELLEEIQGELSLKAGLPIKLPPSVVGEIQTLGKAYERTSAKIESAEDQCRKMERRLRQRTAQRKGMPDPVDMGSLDAALQSARQAGPIERQREEMRTLLAALEKELKQSVDQLPLWDRSMGALDAIALPLEETIDQFEQRFEKSHRNLEKLSERRHAAEEELVQIHTEIKEIDFSRKVPTEADLVNARALRDNLWRVIRPNLEGKTPPTEEVQAALQHFDREASLPDAFETSLSNADLVSDRLRREADQVTRKGLLEARAEKFEKMRVDTDLALDESLACQRLLEKEWAQLWTTLGITPKTPKEMRGWLANVFSLREKRSVLRSHKRQYATISSRCTKLRSDLIQELERVKAPVDEKQSLSQLIKAAELQLASQQDLASSIESADKELSRLETELREESATLDALEGNLAKWRSGWKKATAKIGLDADLSPNAALAVIESVREAKIKTGEAEVLRKRIAGIDRDCSDFTARVRRLVEALAPDLTMEPEDSAAERLNSRLIAARKSEAEHQTLSDRLGLENNLSEDAQRRIAESKAIIEALVREARCTEADSLAEMEKRAREKKALSGERKDVESQLRDVSAGATVAALIDEASAVDADGIAPELSELNEEKIQLDAQRSHLEQKIGALKVTLAQMDGTSKAAHYAQRAERLLGRLESDVENYARLKIASVILARTVEQYREKHQGPLIERAGELFSRMTLGSFSRLRADYDDKGDPVLVGIRAGSEIPVHVTGMSDGTADQLYLALRLASLEQYLEKNESLPFIVDDILLRFDDDRALATLEVLAGLSRKTQVLFFTHHRHLIDLTDRAALHGLAFTLHRLGESQG